MKLIKYWGPVFVWMSTIFYFSGRASVKVSEEYLFNFLFFKSLHVIEYFILFILSFRALINNYKFSSKGHVYFRALLITVIYAAGDEIHQIFVPTRESALRDVIIDCIGGILAWISLVYLLPKAPKKLQWLARQLEVITSKA